MSKETFKSFARNYPELANKVMQGQTSWQKLYELYDIYGENNSIWSEYINPIKPVQSSLTPTQTNQNVSFKDLFNTFKNLDLDSVQKGVTNLQKTIGLLQDIGLTTTKTPKNNSSTYEPRPMYKYFED